MNEDQTIPAALMPRDFLQAPQRSGAILAFWTILIAGGILFLLVSLFN
jgi:hypothetical protein